MESFEPMMPRAVLLNELSCEICGCTFDHPCPGGCAWSVEYLDLGRMVCTRCQDAIEAQGECVSICFSLSSGALRLWMDGHAKAKPCPARL